jgi:hypothetical protein
MIPPAKPIKQPFGESSQKPYMQPSGKHSSKPSQLFPAKSREQPFPDPMFTPFKMSILNMMIDFIQSYKHPKHGSYTSPASSLSMTPKDQSHPRWVPSGFQICSSQ